MKLSNLLKVVYYVIIKKEKIDFAQRGYLLKKISDLTQELEEIHLTTCGNIDLTSHIIFNYLLQDIFSFHDLAKQTIEVAVKIISGEKQANNKNYTAERNNNYIALKENNNISPTESDLEKIVHLVIQKIKELSIDASSKQNSLLHLLYIYKNGLTFLVNSTPYVFGKNLKKEVQIYYQLALRAEERYPLPLMHFLAHLRRDLTTYQSNPLEKPAHSTNLFSNLEQKLESWFLPDNQRSDLLASEKWPDYSRKYAGLFYYDLKNPPVNFSGKAVTKLRLFIIDACDQDYELFSERHALLYIHWKDGSKIVKQLADQYTSAASTLFRELGLLQNVAFDRMTLDSLSWKDTKMSEIYSKNDSKKENVTNDYAHIHEQINYMLSYILKQHPDLEKINIIEGGCGNGELLKSIEELLQQKENLKVNLVGFDFNSNNIKACGHNYQGKAYFFTDNVLRLESVIQDNQQNGLLDFQTMTVLMLSGVISRVVLKNSFEALEVLQQAALSNIEYIVGGAHTEILVNDFIIKRVGYKQLDIPNLAIVPPKHWGKEGFAFQKIDISAILQNKKNKMDKQNLLDLSMAPNPALLLAILQDEMKDNLVIDLSFCRLTDTLITTIHSLHKKLSHIKLIFWHWDENVIDQFAGNFAGKIAILSLNHVTSEIYLMSPRSFFSELHVNNKQFYLAPFNLFSKQEIKPEIVQYELATEKLEQPIVATL